MITLLAMPKRANRLDAARPVTLCHRRTALRAGFGFGDEIRRVGFPNRRRFVAVREEFQERRPVSRVAIPGTRPQTCRVCRYAE